MSVGIPRRVSERLRGPDSDWTRAAEGGISRALATLLVNLVIARVQHLSRALFLLPTPQPVFILSLTRFASASRWSLDLRSLSLSPGGGRRMAAIGSPYSVPIL